MFQKLTVLVACLFTIIVLSLSPATAREYSIPMEPGSGITHALVAGQGSLYKLACVSEKYGITDFTAQQPGWTFNDDGCNDTPTAEDRRKSMEIITNEQVRLAKVREARRLQEHPPKPRNIDTAVAEVVAPTTTDASEAAFSAMRQQIEAKDRTIRALTEDRGAWKDRVTLEGFGKIRARNDELEETLVTKQRTIESFKTDLAKAARNGDFWSKLATGTLVLLVAALVGLTVLFLKWWGAVTRAEQAEKERDKAYDEMRGMMTREAFMEQLIATHEIEEGGRSFQIRFSRVGRDPSKPEDPNHYVWVVSPFDDQEIKEGGLRRHLRDGIAKESSRRRVARGGDPVMDLIRNC